jgi:hypothetical protein
LLVESYWQADGLVTVECNDIEEKADYR